MRVLIPVLLILWILSLFGDPFGGFDKTKTTYLKALLPFLIIIHHVAWRFETWNLISCFKSWGIPIVSTFFFVSGYGLAKSYHNKGQEYLIHFWKKRILKIIIPFVIVQICFCLLNIRSLINPLDYVANLIHFGDVDDMPSIWFVIVIFYLYIVFWLSFSFLEEPYKEPVYCSLCIIQVVVAYMLGYGQWWYCSTLGAPLGLIYANHLETFKFCHKPSIVLCFPVIVLLMGIICYSTKLFYSIHGGLIALFIVLSVSHLKLPAAGKTVLFFSGISYEIYLSQFLWNGIISFLGFGDNRVLYLVFIYIMTIVASFVINRFSNAVYTRLFD